jgi:plasmid replication initiation protein
MKKYDDSIIEHNDLITSMNKMDKTPLKIFEMVVAALDPFNPPKDNTIVLSKEKMFKLFDLKSTNKFSRLKTYVEQLHRQSVFRIKEGEKGGKLVYQVVSPISSTTWHSDDDKVFFKLTDEIMPYLFNLRENYTQLALSDMVSLNSKYSIILYKWFTMFINQYKNYTNSKLRTKAQLDELLNPTMSVEELRIITDTEDSYPRFSEIKRKVLTPALKDINTKTALKVSYDTVKRSRVVSEIHFHLDKDFVAQNLMYKEEENDELAAKSQEKKDQIAVDAVQSVYTSKLVATQLLSAMDIIDKKTMYQVAMRVYPLYDQIVKIAGEKNLEKHMNYVAEYQVDYSKKNIAKYLATAAKDYLNKIKINGSM